MIRNYVEIVGGMLINGEIDREIRGSSLIMTDRDGLQVSGNLPHGYCFTPRSKEDAEALINYLREWIENN